MPPVLSWSLTLYSPLTQPPSLGLREEQRGLLGAPVGRQAAQRDGKEWGKGFQGWAWAEGTDKVDMFEARALCPPEISLSPSLCRRSPDLCSSGDLGPASHWQLSPSAPLVTGGRSGSHCNNPLCLIL